jgi:hypothetical protein
VPRKSNKNRQHKFKSIHAAGPPHLAGPGQAHRIQQLLSRLGFGGHKSWQLFCRFCFWQLLLLRVLLACRALCPIPRSKAENLFDFQGAVHPAKQVVVHDEKKLPGLLRSEILAGQEPSFLRHDGVGL